VRNGPSLPCADEVASISRLGSSGKGLPLIQQGDNVEAVVLLRDGHVVFNGILRGLMGFGLWTKAKFK
jgi:hypothetical protein